MKTKAMCLMLQKWQKMISDYLLFRENLQLVFVLVDARIEPQQIDIDFINNLGENGVPFAIIYTKTDKISKSKTHSTVQKMKNILSETWEELPKIFMSSAVEGSGKEEILSYIEEVNDLFYSNMQK